MPSCTSRGPSIDTITSSNSVETSSARLSSSKPVVNKREAYLLFAEKLAKRAQIAVQQRFAARQHDLPDTQIAQRRAMTLQVGDPHLFVRLPLPDVAHDTAAVAVAVDVQNQDRHGRQHGSGRGRPRTLPHAAGARRTLFPPTQKSLPRTSSASAINWSIGARTHRC